MAMHIQFVLNTSSVREGGRSDGRGRHVLYDVDVTVAGRTIHTISCSDHQDEMDVGCRPEGNFPEQHGARCLRLLARWAERSHDIAADAMKLLTKVNARPRLSRSY